jgi:hypothetical protein
MLLVHGPPALYGDCDGEIEGQSGRVKVKGDGYLLREIRRVKPRMVVCGHVHGAFGVSVIRHDGVQDWLDGLKMGGMGMELELDLEVWHELFGTWSLLMVVRAEWKKRW